MSSPATRCFWWCRSFGAHRARNPEVAVRAELLRLDWPAEEAYFTAQIVADWVLRGQRHEPLGDEPAPCALDAALLRQHVMERA